MNELEKIRRIEQEIKAENALMLAAEVQRQLNVVNEQRTKLTAKRNAYVRKANAYGNTDEYGYGPYIIAASLGIHASTVKKILSASVLVDPYVDSIVTSKDEAAFVRSIRELSNGERNDNSADDTQDQ